VILLSQTRRQRKNSTPKAAFIFIPFNLRDHQNIFNRKSSLSPTVCIDNAGEDLTVAQGLAPAAGTSLITLAFWTFRGFGHQGLNVLPEIIGNFPRLSFGHADSINTISNHTTVIYG